LDTLHEQVEDEQRSAQPAPSSVLSPFPGLPEIQEKMVKYGSTYVGLCFLLSQLISD